jgi:signal transduction histidine kinase
MRKIEQALILIVDDQRENLDAILGYLKKANGKYKFLQATDGKMALKVALKRQPDLIIMDWEMPEMNGYEALLELKKDKITEDIPVIMATGRTEPEDLQKAFDAGASDYIRKPVEELELFARVNTCLSINYLLNEVKQKNSSLQDLSREKDGMMSIVAHDLRTPLNNIKGLTQLLSMVGKLTEEQNEFVTKIDLVVKRGNELIRDILDINSVKNAKTALDTSSIQLFEFVNSWKNNFVQQLEKKNQKLVVSGNFEDLSIDSDKNMITRILDNIFTNAMKFSESGCTIFLTVNASEKYVIFSIKDQGPGISRSDQKKMFKPFTKLTATPTGGEASNGLGLSIIKALVLELSGEIEFVSKLGEGSEFIISIPRTV